MDIQLNIDPSLYQFQKNTCSQDIYEYVFYLEHTKIDELENLCLSFMIDLVDIVGVWTPLSDINKCLGFEWSKGITPKNCWGSPVVSFFNQQSNNIVTLALSQTVTPSNIRYGIKEETGQAFIRIYPYISAQSKICPKLTLRLDLKKRSLNQTLMDIDKWWITQLKYPLADLPSEAFAPAYSTWYNFHQDLHQETLLEECKIASDLGMRTLIIDDGWQSDDETRGYHTCGDWEISTKKFPDMEQFVQDIHQLDMKVILWFALPFIGEESSHYLKFEKYALEIQYDDAWEIKRKWMIYDPRYPIMREYISQKLVNTMRRWNLDGFKLDFLDAFSCQESEYKDEMDISDLETALNLMLFEIYTKLKKINPRVLIEFRQPYNNPNMKSFANIFRAADCPNNGLLNKIRTNDLRLMGSHTAIHSDMIMWNPKDTLTSISQQIVSALFSVLQISVLLKEQRPEVLSLVRWWLQFTQDYQEILLHSPLEFKGIEAHYTHAIAQNKQQWLCILFQKNALELPSQESEKIIIINASPYQEIFLQTSTYAIRYSLLNHSGNPCAEKELTPYSIHKIKLKCGFILFIQPIRCFN